MFLFPIADLHCDLLAYLAEDNHRKLDHPESRCSTLQMKTGNVQLQTLAVFTETIPTSLTTGRKQLDAYKKFSPSINIHTQTFYAFENASGFCDEIESIDNGLQRLQTYLDDYGSPLYVGFTWKEENRFGGGNLTHVGLKEDGKRLLELLFEKKIAVDFSHTSDQLAEDLLQYIEQNCPKHPVLASHSNFRAIQKHPRNLPDWLALEIIQRKGLIGLNFLKTFIGKSYLDLCAHIDYGLKLGAEKQLCFGADFFYDDLITESAQALHTDGLFFEELSDASKYQRFLDDIVKEKQYDANLLKSLSAENVLSWPFLPTK